MLQSSLDAEKAFLKPKVVHFECSGKWLTERWLLSPIELHGSNSICPLGCVLVNSVDNVSGRKVLTSCAEKMKSYLKNNREQTIKNEEKVITKCLICTQDPHMSTYPVTFFEPESATRRLTSAQWSTCRPQSLFRPSQVLNGMDQGQIPYDFYSHT